MWHYKAKLDLCMVGNPLARTVPQDNILVDNLKKMVMHAHEKRFFAYLEIHDADENTCLNKNSILFSFWYFGLYI
jgi:hypothetical protein